MTQRPCQGRVLNSLYAGIKKKAACWRPLLSVMMMAPMVMVPVMMVVVMTPKVVVMTAAVMMMPKVVMMMASVMVMMLNRHHQTAFVLDRNGRQWRRVRIHNANAEGQHCSEK
jgi:hypothetical protein